MKDTQYYYRYYSDKKKWYLRNQTYSFVVITEEKLVYVIYRDGKNKKSFNRVFFDRNFKRIAPSIIDFTWSEDDVETFIKNKQLVKPNRSELAKLLLLA
jgi:hypothetical protein